MAINGRFDLGLRVLVLLAEDPGRMHTSAAIAEALGTSPVMVRRAFLMLHKAGFIAQRKGPHGGARLKLSPKEVGLGDIFAAMSDDWLLVGDKALDPLLKRAQADAVKAMNETTLAQMVKRLKKV
jgi:DNA-binding IscR family transcriptional regulator